MRATIFEALGSFLFILLFIYGSVDMPRVGPLREDPHTFRWFFLLCIASFEVCANAWRVVMFLNLLTIYRNPFNPERHRKLYIISVTLSGFITLSAVSWSSAVKKDSQELGLAEFFCVHAWIYVVSISSFRRGGRHLAASSKIYDPFGVERKRRHAP